MSWTAMATVEVCTTAECYQSAIEDGNYRKVLEDFVAISDEETDKTTIEAVRYVLENEGLENIVEFLAMEIAFNGSATDKQRKSATTANSFGVLELLSLSYLMEESFNEKLITAIANDEDSEVIANIQTSLRYWNLLKRVTLRNGLNSDSEEIKKAVSELAIENGDANLVFVIEAINPLDYYQKDTSNTCFWKWFDSLKLVGLKGQATVKGDGKEKLLSEYISTSGTYPFTDETYKAFLRSVVSKCS